MDVSNATLSPHADERMGRRRIDRDEVRQVLVAPDEILPARSGRVVAQKVLGRYLLRVFVDVDRTPPEVVTVYRTSKIDKYRSTRR